MLPIILAALIGATVALVGALIIHELAPRGARYQVAPAGDRSILLDTKTAETWVLDLDKKDGLVWLPFDPPPRIQTNLTQALRDLRTARK